MKKLITLSFILAVILSGCGSSKKQLEKGNYDAAIVTAVKKLRKDADDTKQIETLRRSYQVINDQDNERIRFLKLEGKPQSWDEIYQIYKRLSDRQALVKTIMPLSDGTNISMVDYLPEMVTAKRKSADFYYAHGNELMKSGLKESYRQAYYEFIRAKDYVGDYEGIDNKILESKALGISRVFVSLQNTTPLKFPADMEEDLLSVDLQSLNGEWVEFTTMNLDSKAKYDYYVNVNVKNILVSPDNQFEKDSVMKKDVEDGFSYQLDKKGNVMRDSLGNDIKVKKYKTLQCALIQTIQNKTCQISGDIDIIQVNPNKQLKKDPIGAQTTFENVSARAVGDVNALNSSQLERTKTQIVPFPSDIEMVIRCSETLKSAIRGSIQTNRQLIY